MVRRYLDWVIILETFRLLGITQRCIHMWEPETYLRPEAENKPTSREDDLSQTPQITAPGPDRSFTLRSRPACVFTKLGPGHQ